MNPSIFYRNFLYALRVVLPTNRTFNTYNEKFHSAFEEMLDSAATEISIESSFNPMFCISRNADTMIFEARRDFIVEDLLRNNPLIQFRISKETAETELNKNPHRDKFIESAKYLLKKIELISLKALSPEITTFAHMMEHELNQNAHKGTWKNCPPQQILSDVLWHVAKLGWAVKEGNLDKIAEYSADVANMAMMVADTMGAIKPFDDRASNNAVPAQS